MPGVIVPGRDGPPRQQGSQLCGRILWLPKKEWIKVAGDKLDEGCYQHPVVILSAGPKEGKVDLFLVRPSRIKSKHLHLHITSVVQYV